MVTGSPEERKSRTPTLTPCCVWREERKLGQSRRVAAEDLHAKPDSAPALQGIWAQFTRPKRERIVNTYWFSNAPANVVSRITEIFSHPLTNIAHSMDASGREVYGLVAKSLDRRHVVAYEKNRAPRPD